MAYITALVKSRIAKLLRKHIALEFDGWIQDNTHYLAVFASFLSFNSKGKETRFLDLSKIGDECSLSSKEHHEFLMLVLELCFLNWTNIACLTGDNVSTNKALSNIIKIPLIGCTSHRFHLDVQDILHTEQDVIDKVRTTMIKMRGLLRNARLKKFRRLQPKLSNKTRSSSVYEMLKRCVRIREHLSSLELNKLDNCCPSSPEYSRVDNLLKKLEPSKSLTKTFQDDETTVSDARAVSGAVTEIFPNSTHRL